MTRITTPACTAVARVIGNGNVVYSQGFESSADSWTATAPASAGRTQLFPPVLVPHRGSWGLMLTPNTVGARYATRVISGLTSGKEYIFSAWALQVGGFVSGVQIGVTGIGTTALQSIASVGWVRVWYRFTATGSFHTFELSSTTTAGGGDKQVAFDSVELYELGAQTGEDIPLGLRPGSTVTVDERVAPYVQARLNIALPEQAEFDLLDTRSSTSTVRVTVTLEQEFVEPAMIPPQERVFDLLLHERSAEFSADTDVVLVCHSDEAILIDAGNSTDTVDATPSLAAPSLRAIVATMLQRHGMFLEPGAADADYTITTALTNLLPNPSAEVDAAGWTNAGAVTRSSTVGGFAGGYAIRATAAASTMRVIAATGTSNPHPASEGDVMTCSAYVRGQVARDTHAELLWRDIANTTIATDLGSVITSTTTGWTRITVTGTAPAGTVGVLPVIEVAGNSVGQFTYIDAAMLFVHPPMFLQEPVPYFDGATATDTYYTYAWEGTAHASRSRRIRLDDRDSQLLLQDPGEKDFDVLAQIVQAAGLRLFCDESRRWWLVDPATYIFAGTLALAQAKRGRDLISRERGDWADAVVVKYSWIGEDGVSEVRYDAASVGTSLVELVTWDRPWPGPGAAAAILARYTGRGRVQEIVAPPELAATPAMALTTDLPNTPEQDGFVSRVSFTLAADAIEMSVNARDLVDA